MARDEKARDMSRPEGEEHDEEDEEMVSNPHLVDEDEDDQEEGSYDDNSNNVEVYDDDGEEEEGFGDYYDDGGSGEEVGAEGEEYYEGSESYSHSRSYSQSQNNRRYEDDDGSFSQHDDGDEQGQEVEVGGQEEEDYDDENSQDCDDSRHRHKDISRNDTDDTDNFEDSKEYFDDQPDDDDGEGYYDDDNGIRTEEDGSYEDDEGYVDEEDESRSRSRKYEEEDDDEGNSPSKSSYDNSPSRSSERWSDGSGGRRSMSPRDPRTPQQQHNPSPQSSIHSPPVHIDDDHYRGGGGESSEDINREAREILKAANERLSPEKQKRGGLNNNIKEEVQEKTSGSSSFNNMSTEKDKPKDGSENGDVASAEPNSSRAGQNQRKNQSLESSPKRGSGGGHRSANSSGETSLDNTGHMEALQEQTNNVKNVRGTVTSSAIPSAAASAPPPASKKDGAIPKGSTGSRSQRNGRVGSSSHHRRRHQGQGVGGGVRISWKSDPDATFSDWTIRVYHDEGGGGMDKYFIHRNICGFGTRKSGYLLRAFQGEENEMTQPGIKSDLANRTTLLDLPSTQARVFPMVLDFMYYTKEAKSTLTASRACDVFLLAGILEIPLLQKAISDFYLKNLNLKNMGEFLNAANQSKAEPLLVVCKSKIGKMITEKPTLAGLVPPKYLADILLISRQQLDNARAKDPERYPEQLAVSQSRYWSKAACICAVQNESILTKNLFELLTGEDALPYIDASVAQKLLALDRKFNDVESDGYTSLQLRCIAGIADDFGSFQRGFQSEDAAVESLKEWPSHVLADILVKTMNKK